MLRYRNARNGDQDGSNIGLGEPLKRMKTANWFAALALLLATVAAAGDFGAKGGDRKSVV